MEALPAETRSAGISLEQNSPNPFNPSTVIGFSLDGGQGRVSLGVYNLAGQLVRTLIVGQAMAAGSHSAVWDGKDSQSRDVAAGVYFYSLEVGKATYSRKLLLVR